MSSRSDLRAANDDSNEEGVLTFDHILAKSCLEGERPAITALKASEVTIHPLPYTTMALFGTNAAYLSPSATCG
jgi:hypothetical protein